MVLVLDTGARVLEDYSSSTKSLNPRLLPQTILTIPSIRDPVGMLARTERQADPIRAPVYRKLPNLVRIFSPVAILPDPRAYLAICGSRIVMKFQPSPFLRVDQAVSNIEECPGQLLVSSAVLRVSINGRNVESTSSVDRKQAGLTFTLTPEQRQKLDSTTYVNSTSPQSAQDLTKISLQEQVPTPAVLHIFHILLLHFPNTTGSMSDGVPPCLRS